MPGKAYHNNPVVDGLVENPEDYLFSSARSYYADKDSLVDVFVLPHEVKVVR